MTESQHQYQLHFLCVCSSLEGFLRNSRNDLAAKSWCPNVFITSWPILDKMKHKNCMKMICDFVHFDILCISYELIIISVGFFCRERISVEMDSKAIKLQLSQFFLILNFRYLLLVRSAEIIKCHV